MPPDAEAARQLLDRQIGVRRAHADAYLVGRQDFAVGRAEGAYIFDEYGLPRLDFGLGGQHNILGHRHDETKRLITAHLHQYVFTGDDHLCRLPVDYAAALSARFPHADGAGQQVLVTTSLSDAWAAIDKITADDEMCPGVLDLVLPDRCIRRDISFFRDEGRRIVADETRAGFGRTGPVWAHQRHDVAPDITVLGPPGASGMPFYAVVAPRAAFAALDPADIPVTANHPIVCAAAHTTLAGLTDGVLTGAAATASVLQDGLVQLREAFPDVIAGHNGVGLLQKITICDTEQRQRFRQACHDSGLVVHPDLTLTPPLTVTQRQVAAAINVLADVCQNWS